ncbi:uncharacterized protein Nost isoform X2 [Planococcus citri]|uniref:uncharacterized protein Nost isoform X2 n=1 Tax=Planococcus citri TaxID=170843 RepID=UPI0031F9BE01
MSDKRWWSIPRMFVFPLWNSGTNSAVETNHVNKVNGDERCSPGSEKLSLSHSPAESSDDDEDIEEFLEKQRNARLGCKDNIQQVSVKSRKYSTPQAEEEIPETKKVHRRSKRFSRSSSSKSSTSTKYSSAGKTSDVENEKIIKETIYEVTGSAPPISFSFFQENPQAESEGCVQISDTNNDETFYINASLTDDPINQIDQRDNPSNNVIPIDEPGNWPESSIQRREIESPEHLSATASASGSSSKERHVTKLTILLSPARNADPVENGEEIRSECGNDDDTPDCLYSVIDKNTKSRVSASSPEPEMFLEDPLNNPDYAELSEFHSKPPADEVTSMEYCQHRAKFKTRFRKLSLRRKRRTSTQPTLKKMNLNINRAWKSIRGWWHEEKSKLGHIRSRSFGRDDPKSGSSISSCSDKSFYASIRHLDLPEEKHFTPNQLDEDGYCTLELKTDRDLASETDKMVDSDHRPDCDAISEFSPVRRRSKAPLPPPLRMSTVNAFRKSRYTVQGQDGFEELRRYIKQGGDFCKELSVILQERSEAEIQYAKTLSKLSNKLLKVSKEAVGTVSQAWHKAGIELETTSEIHKTFATALCEEVVKPLKQLLESQHRIRKSVENAVDKTGKNLSEWRAAESKSKKQSFVSARENEKLQDVTLDVRLSGGLTGSNKLTASSLHLHQKQGSDKESSKLESKRKKAEELVKKSDVEYYTYCIRAERARLEWETAVIRGSQCFQALEEERLQQLKHLAFVYWQHCRDVGPKLTQSALRLKDPIENCDVANDIKTIATTKGIEQPVSEQLLPDFYAEHTTLAMNKERRRQALVKVLQLVVQDLERERRGKNGVENLARAFKQSPNFGNDDSQQNVSEKLHHMRFMLTYLEAARYKVSCALAELDGKPKPSHPLATHIHVIRDRQGFQQSILKVPPWVQKDANEQPEQVESPDWTDRDEFSSQGSSEKDFESNVFTVLPDSTVSTPTPSAGGRCKALYHYTANLYDELNLQPGDVINIHDKQPDGWWLGELNGIVGIFPATYVEEIS